MLDAIRFMRQTKLTDADLSNLRLSTAETNFQDALKLTMDLTRDTLAFLIEHRERLRDEVIERLEAESARLADRLQNLERQKLLEELRCFKDVLSLHKRLMQENGPLGD